MSALSTHSFKRISVMALATCLAISAGCATKPKTVPPVASTSASTAASASPARTNAPSTAQPTSGGPTALAPITRSQDINQGANLGLRPQPTAASASAATIQAAASLAEAGDRIYFMTDRFDLTDEARNILARQAAWISANPAKRVIVAGSADERGTREYNLALGSKRASAARDYLISLGINGASIETVSYGKERPIDARSNPDGWAVNRNSQTQLLD